MTFQLAVPQVQFADAKRKTERAEKPWLALLGDIQASHGETDVAKWQFHAARMQDDGYLEIMPGCFEHFAKGVGKPSDEIVVEMRKVVDGAIAKCEEVYPAAKHYFEGERLEKTMKRIGAIFILAQRCGKAFAVCSAFSKILVGHGIEVPQYLEPKAIAIGSERREDRRDRREGRRDRNDGDRRSSGSGMFTHVPVKRPMMLNAAGALVPVRYKHKEIAKASPEEQERNRLAKIAARNNRKAERAARKAAKKAEAKAEKGKKNAKQTDKRK